ncbi:MAG: tape measure protein [Duncaniella sp.]|nr:tape measure protein [Duncaniella sp.]
MDNAIQGVGRTIASLGLAWSMQDFARKVATVRGEFQQLEVAMETMLGSAAKAQTLMSQMVQTAATTPFGLQEVANGAKQLLAYGLGAEKVNDTLIRLGDIAAGLSLPLGDLVYLYGTTMAQGRLYTQDLNQFTGRGIPMLRELAAQFGVAENKVKDLVEAGKVGFPEVQKVIENLTNEGGTFGGLMEKQSHTITGQISNIEDAFDMMFNEIGEKSEGVINDALEATSWLVENYKVTAEALMTLVATYGVYKATLIATAAYTNAAYNYEATQLKALLAEKSAEIDADLADAVAKGNMSAARAQEVQALRMELAATIENAKANAIEAQAEASEATRKRMLAQLAYNKARAEVEAKQEEIAAMESIYAHQTAETLQKEKDVLVTKMHAAQEKLDAAAKVENAAKTKAATTAQAVNTLTTQRDTITKKLNVTQTKLLTLVNNGLTKALHALKAAWATNPVGLILMGVTMVAGAMMTLNDAMDTTALESKKFGEAAAGIVRNVDTLFAVLKSTSPKSNAHADAIDELCKIYEEYGLKIDDERDKLTQLNELREQAIELIRKEGEERDKANNIAAYDEALSKSTEKMKEELLNQLKEAEWDGSGFFDDWDADKVQDRAAELTAIISGIYESEAAEIAKIVDDKEREAKIAEVQNRAVTAFQHVMGYSNDEKGFTAASWAMSSLDVDFTGILNKYIEKTNDLTNARQHLVNSYSTGASGVAEEAAEVDYASLSFDKLFDSAYKAEGKIESLGAKTVAPTINTTSIDAAIDGVNTLIGGFNTLFGADFSTPEVPWLDLATYRAGNATTAFTSTANASQQKAQAELERRMAEAIKTRKGTSDLLKEVNSALETAVGGSDDEKRLISLQKRLNDQKKKFDSAEGKGRSSRQETAEQTASKIEKAEAEVTALLKKSAEDREKLMRDLEFQREQNEIDMELNYAERKRRQLKLDQDKEIAELQSSEKAAIDAEIDRQKRIFDARENAKAAADKKYAKRNFTDSDIDQSEIEAIREQYDALFTQLDARQRREQADLLRSDFETMNDFLKQYGSFQQQKLAIAEEYARKIREASSEGERMALERERDNSLASVRAAEIKENIDWSVVFGEFGGMFSDVIAPALDDLKEYVKTDEFKNSDAQSQKAIIEAMQQMESALGSADKVSFEKLGKEITSYQKALANLKGAQTDYADKFATLKAAQDAYVLAVESGTQEQIDAAKKAVDTARLEADASSQNLQTMQTAVNETKAAVSQTANALKTAMDNVVGGMQKLAGGSVSGVYEGLIQMGKGMKALKGMPKGLADAFGKVSDKLEKVPVIGWIAQIIDLFKDGISVVVGGLLDAVFNAVSGIIGDVLNFRDGLIRQIGESLITGIGSIFEAVFTLGGWFDWIGGGDSDPHLEEDMERLSQTNEALQRAIENLTDVMNDAAMFDVSDIFNQQKQLLDESEANTRQQMIRTGAAYNSGVFGIGGSHSSNSKIDNGMSSADWTRITKIVGPTVRSASDFWNLTSEQMRKLAVDAPDLYAKLKDLADEGYKDAGQYMDQYIDYAKQREELEKAYKEKLTNVSFDSLRDSFKSALTDMEISASDLAKKFNDLLVDSIAEALMTNKYDPLIKDLYDKWADFMEGDGMIDDDELRQLQADRDAIFDSMTQDREFLKMINTGDTTQSQGLNKGFATASQDSIDELNGRFAALQIDTSIIRETLTGISDNMGDLHLTSVEIKQLNEEIRNLSLMAIDYLERIVSNTNELPEMNERLGKIEKNTRNL